MNAITFRQATRADCGLILRFIKDLAAYEHMADQVVATEKILEDWLFVQEKAAALFAAVDGLEVGFALYFPVFSTFLAQAGFYIEDLFVQPEYRGCGIGKALFTELARIAGENGYTRLEWQCLDWNQKSIDFYRSLGAQPKSGWTTYRLPI
ncbi:MAG: GNAT family N-acetyltransferase [Peptococcaceae bacterium]|jgi:GNAT superfamily N-acetyltransferase|nr:GNAT family N-acetyltransferase [Peptococcaceae bacterium]